MCPFELLDNTKISMGECQKVHADSLKQKYEAELAKVCGATHLPPRASSTTNTTTTATTPVEWEHSQKDHHCIL